MLTRCERVGPLLKLKVSLLRDEVTSSPYKKNMYRKKKLSITEMKRGEKNKTRDAEKGGVDGCGRGTRAALARRGVAGRSATPGHADRP